MNKFFRPTMRKVAIGSPLVNSLYEWRSPLTWGLGGAAGLTAAATAKKNKFWWGLAAGLATKLGSAALLHKAYNNLGAGKAYNELLEMYAYANAKRRANGGEVSRADTLKAKTDLQLRHFDELEHARAELHKRGRPMYEDIHSMRRALYDGSANPTDIDPRFILDD